MSTLVAGMLVSAPLFGQSRAPLVFGNEYSCNEGQTRFVVRSCKQVYTFETCDVQYLNAAAPNGLGARVDIRKETLEGSLKGCTVAGKPVNTTEQQEGTPGQALSLGTWYDVKILGQSGDKVHVRFAAGNEDWLDSSRVRRSENGPATKTGGSLPDGRYACISWIGNRAVTFGFVDIQSRSYRGPSMNPGGAFAPFRVGEDGALMWSKGFGEFDKNGAHYESARIVPGDKPRFNVRYRTASGRAEGMDCGRE